MTDLKTHAGRLALGAARWSGSAALSRLATRPFGAIFTLHHVSPALPTTFSPNGHLRVQPAFLSAVIRHLRRRDCDIVDLGEAVRRIEEGRRDRFFACFTLDDGYLNNAEHAVPIFRREGVPYAIFVAPGLSDGSVLPWWEAAEAIVRRRDRVVLPWAGGRSLDAASPRDKRRVFDALSIHLTGACPEEAVQAAVRGLAEANGGDLDLGGDVSVMCWERIAALADDPLATIGAHSLTHPCLARLPAEAAFREIAGSREIIAARLGRTPDVFAYPYGFRGACGPREYEMAARAGFRAAFTTRLHALTERSARNVQALPRLSLNGYYQDVRDVDVLMSGLPGLWRERRA